MTNPVEDDDAGNRVSFIMTTEMNVLRKRLTMTAIDRASS
jgi:hypothetical protein